MTATENLENDHIHILRLCDIMERMAHTNSAVAAHFETVVSLIRKFADGLHHKKEEDLLFPGMAKKGFSLQQGPVAVMLHDHELGRSYVRAMAENIALLKSGNNEALNGIHRNMLNYVELLRSHIAKENNVLFRMADNVLTAAEQAELISEFRKAEENLPEGESGTGYIRSIDELAERYGFEKS